MDTFLHLLQLFFTSLFFTAINGQNCIFTDQSGVKLYLDALEHSTLKFTAFGQETSPRDTHTYIFTPCRNAAGECPDSNGGTNTAMVRQIMEDDADICTVIANYDSSIIPAFSTDLNGTWEFQYMNGDSEGCTEARSFNAFFFCDLNAGDYQITGGGEREGEDAACRYYVNINTKWACPGQVFVEEDNSNSLSGGTIFCIVLLCALFSYFCCGWVICATLNRKDRGFGDVTGNIPHYTFWTKLPALTFAGCCFTKDFCVGLCGKEDNSSNDGTSYDDIDQYGDAN